MLPENEDDRAFFREADRFTAYTGNALYNNKHPFLVNATTNSVMREWMIEFRDSLADWLVTVGLDDLDPNKFQYAFDTEALVTQEGPESVKMLAFLADYDDIWETWVVPGSRDWQPHSTHDGNPNGQTLEEMYDEMVLATEGGPDEWPDDILTVLNPQLNHEDPANRKFCVWFFSVCERAKEALMFVSAYEILHTGENGAKCSNYNAANYDDLTAGFPDTTPTTIWFADKSAWASIPDPANAASWNPANFPQNYTQDMPGAYFSPQPSASLFEPSGVSDRYLGYRRYSKGQIDSPELYQLSDAQWSGVTNATHGHWSLNPYVPVADQWPAQTTYPLAGSNTTWGVWTPLMETKAQRRLEIARHASESNINAGDGGNEDRLGPWVNEYISHSYTDIEQRNAEREYRMVLAMLRGKNVPYIKYFFTERRDLDEYPPYVRTKAFEDTRALTKRVWATEVVSVQTIIGIDDSQPPTSLEYTLRDGSGNDQTFAVIDTAEEPDPQHRAAIEVVVRVPEDFQLQFDFEINLETLMPEGSTGQLLARSRAGNGGNFVLVPTMEGETGYFPDTTAEFETLGSAPRPMRRTFWLEEDTEVGGGYHQFVFPANGTYAFPHMVLRMYHQHAGEEEVSSFDLLQVIPVDRFAISVMDPKEALSVADLNADNCVDVADLQLFVNGFMDENAIADLDSDQDWDQDDIDLFLEAYSNE